MHDQTQVPDMKIALLLIFGLLFARISVAQLPLTVEQCEASFLKNNLLILAEQYNIEAARANIIQAKIWDLPYLSGEFNLINPQGGRVLDVGGRGQKGLAVQQLIYLGGKKKNEVEFARSNIAIAELQYEQLLRDLRYRLHQNFYELYFNQQKTQRISEKLDNIDTLTQAYNLQSQRGNIPLKDVVRLQSLALAYKSDLMEIQRSVFEEQENLKILTGTPYIIDAQVSPEFLEQKYRGETDISENDLFAKALQNNPLYLTSLKIIESSERYLKWQNSLSKPDLTVGTSYDQRGGAFGNQVNLTFGIPLNLWNRNKGNIQLANVQLAQNTTLKDQRINELKAQLDIGMQAYTYQLTQYRSTSGSFQSLETLYSGTLQNFQKRNISLLEFSDFMESYLESIIYLNEIKKQLVLSGENLNYLTNEKLF